MTAAEYFVKWFDHPENRKVFYVRGLTVAPPGGDWRQAVADYESVPEEQRPDIDKKMKEIILGEWPEPS